MSTLIPARGETLYRCPSCGSEIILCVPAAADCGGVGADGKQRHRDVVRMEVAELTGAEIRARRRAG